MKRSVVLAVVSTPLIAAGLLCGCRRKPPAALVGKWEYQQSMGRMGRVLQWLTLEGNGRFRVTGPAPGAGVSRGPVSGKEEVIQAGTYEVKRGEIYFTTVHSYVNGEDQGSPLPGAVVTPYHVSGNILTIQEGAVSLVPKLDQPGNAGNPGLRPPSELALTRVGP